MEKHQDGGDNISKEHSILPEKGKATENKSRSINQESKQFAIETKWNQHYHYFDGFTVDSKHGSWCNNYQAQ